MGESMSLAVFVFVILLDGVLAYAFARSHAQALQAMKEKPGVV